MSKSRNFSIYLLKVGFAPENALKDDHNLELINERNTNLPAGSIMYIANYPGRPPWWKVYWGLSRNLNQMLKGAIVFIPIEDRWTALTFGMTFHKLKDESYEYDFGLRTTLNALDPEKVKSTDILLPENARRQRIQSPVAINLNYFDFKKDESIIKKLTGAVKDNFTHYFKNVTGSNSLRISTNLDPEEIPGLCSTLFEIYQRDDYLTSFPDIHNITPIKDPVVLERLNEKLLEDFFEETIFLVLSIPDVIDYSDAFKVKFSGAGRSNKEYEDVYIGAYREYLQYTGVEDITIDTFKHHKMKIIDDNGHVLKEYKIYKSFLFDCEVEEAHYHLCEGEWYSVESDYITRISNSVNPHFVVHHPLLSTCNGISENEYNISISENSPNVICLDGENIAPQGQSRVEPCDLIAVVGDDANLIHVKISTRSTSLSHLFNQGVNSVELLRMEQQSKDKLKDLVNDNAELIEKIEADKFKVTYAIITKKARSNTDNLSKNIPLFSRISLMRTLDTLKVMGIPREVCFIYDEADRRNRN